MAITPGGGFQVIRTTGNQDLDEELLRMRDDINSAGSTPGPRGPAGPPGAASALPAIQPAQSVTDIAPVAAVGTAFSYAREDHAHDGVTSLNGAKGVLNDRYTGTVVLGAPSATFVVTHSLAVPTPFLVMVDVYTSGGLLVETAGATFVFTTNGLTITFGSPLAAATYTVLVLS